jgi:cell filamentation protein
VAHPWDTGDPDRNWQGYFIPGTRVLRNRIGATTHAELQDAENDLVEARVVELRENPGLLAPCSYDLRFLQAIHRHLFQDVYLWAGDVRTVGIEKGDESFCPPDSIAYLYDYVNFAHPFREGNGRATREFFNLLLAERGSGLDWNQTDVTELHSACHTARADGDLTGLTRMFAKILDTDPAYDF